MTTNLNLAIEAALKAGNSIIEIYNNPESDFQNEVKKDNSPLTIADKTAHNDIVSLLSKSGYNILSEEGEHLDYNERSQWSTLWIVDPLDGTKEFIKRNGDFTVNIALWDNNELTMGIIYVPVHKVLYFAQKNLGSYKVENISYGDDISMDSLLYRAAKLPLERANNTPLRVVASVSHMTTHTTEYIDMLKEQYNNNIEIVSRGSSLKICMVAEGSADIYPRFSPTMEWDTAAGHAIALFANKNMYTTDEHGVLSYNKENLLNPYFIVK